MHRVDVFEFLVSVPDTLPFATIYKSNLYIVC